VAVVLAGKRRHTARIRGAPGAYQGVFNGGFAASQMLAPLVVTATAIHLGRPGWLILAAVFVGAGAALVPASRWAVRTRTVSVSA
jgi:hypothetical protein